MEQALMNRGAVGAVILAAHAGLVLLLMSTGLVRPATSVPSVAVSFIAQSEHQPERSGFDQPTLTPLNRMLVLPPDVTVAIEPENEATSATATQIPPTPPPSESASSGTATIAELSEVAYLVQPAPRYPPESRRIREQGLVVLRVLIDETGHAKTIEVYRSSGHPRLDEAARAAVARAVFKPFMDGGVARACAAIVPVEFSLRASSS